MKVLVLDDAQERLDAFKKNLPKEALLKIAITSTETIGYLATDNFDVLFLDHDVPDINVSTGLNVTIYLNLRRIVSGIPEPKRIVIHSRNYFGSNALKQLLPNAICWPGVWDFPDILTNLCKV
jgi:CheY-like chemotaxis protein